MPLPTLMLLIKPHGPSVGMVLATVAFFCLWWALAELS